MQTSASCSSTVVASSAQAQSRRRNKKRARRPRHTHTYIDRSHWLPVPGCATIFPIPALSLPISARVRRAGAQPINILIPRPRAMLLQYLADYARPEKMLVARPIFPRSESLYRAALWDPICECVWERERVSFIGKPFVFSERSERWFRD